MEIYYRLDKGFSLERTPEIARRAETIGFDGISAIEFNHDPFLPLVLAAQATKRIKLETRIAVAFPRSPTVVAYSAWDLQRISHGRFKLGLGTQAKIQNEQRFATKWTSPIPRFREYVGAIREVWRGWRTGTQPNFNGEHYNVTTMSPEFTPEEIAYPPPPIYLAAVNPRACRLAGEIADGVMFQTLCSTLYLKTFTLPAVAEGAAMAGRAPSDIRFSASTYVAAAGSKAGIKEARALARRYVAFMASYSSLYEQVFRLHGWDDEYVRMTQLAIEGRREEIGDLVTDQILDMFVIVGEYDEIGPLLHARWEGIADELGLFLFLPPLTYRQEGTALRSILAGFRH